jgi:hypothetical protein
MFSAGAEVDILPPVPVHALKPVPSTASPPPESFRSQDELNGLPRSASYTHLPGVPETQPTAGIKRTFSDNVLALSPDGSSKTGQSPYVPSKELLRSASRSGKGKIAVTKFTLSAEDLEHVSGNDTKKPVAVAVTEKMRPSTGRSVSSTFRNLARRPWKTSSSRSPSPAPKEARRLAKSRHASPEKKHSISVVTEPITTPSPVASRPSSRSADVENSELKASHDTSPLPLQRPSPQSKSSRRPLSAILQINKSETELGLSKKPSLQSLRSKRSSDKLSRPPPVKVPPIPSSLSSDRLSSASVDTNKKKDPLWSVFRTLDADFQK